MSWEDDLKRNIVWFALGLLVTGFLAGISVYAFLASFNHSSSTPEGGAEWSDKAKNAGWVLKAECPAFPLSIKISAPGDGATVKVSNSGGGDSSLRTPVVIQTDRPVPETNSVGYVWTYGSNYYVKFSYLQDDPSRKVFREDGYIGMPFRMSAETPSITLRAIVTDDPKKLEGTYSTIEQIKNGDPSAVISQPVTMNAQIED